MKLIIFICVFVAISQPLKAEEHTKQRRNLASNDPVKLCFEATEPSNFSDIPKNKEAFQACLNSYAAEKGRLLAQQNKGQ